MKMEEAYYIQNVTMTESNEEYVAMDNSSTSSTSRGWLGLMPMFFFILVVVLRISWTLYRSFGQKTRSPQPRRTPAATRPRHSLGAQEPTIYISPSNLPPPPKYEYMAPPSYEEVVGVHYPSFGAQPIAQPISTALAQASAQAEGSSAQHDTAPSISVVNEQRRISVAVAST